MDIQQQEHCKLLVIGESCRDLFIYGEVSRLCPEAPAPVFNFMHKTENAGMAGNVSANLTSLGVEHDFITNKNYKIVKKVRYVDYRTNTLFIRVDKNDDKIERCDVSDIDFSLYSAVIISDYCKGFLTEADITFITDKHDVVFLDTKKTLAAWCEKAFIIKINASEAENSTSILGDEIKKKIICTLGHAGCVYGEKKFPVTEVPIKDVSGAGDTFLAALVACYTRYKDLERAIKFANKCATEVVQKRGVVPVRETQEKHW
jgi:bifunctional ADP-heptose synthase (sugar kinase/adenylyltransferase)